MKQIEHYFATDGESFKPEPEKKAGEMIAEDLKTIREELSALREENQEIKIHLKNQEDFNKALVEQLQKFERGSVERDDQLTKLLKKPRNRKS